MRKTRIKPKHEWLKRFLFLFIASLAFMGFFLSCQEEDSGGSGSKEEDDDDDATDDDDAADDDDDACSEPVETPEGYFPYEASWLLATFDDPDLPFTGLYAYFWVDWYVFTQCSYTAALSVLYPDGGAIDDSLSTGGMFSGLEIEFADGYDIFVKPYIHVRVDPEDPARYFMDLYGNGYEILLEIEVRHVKIWSGQWFSFYDAAITDASIQYNGKSYQTTGKATLERWYSVGGLDPTKADFVKGFWLYDSFTWENDNGDIIHSLIHYWYTKQAGQDEFEVVPTYGVISRGTTEYIVAQSDLDVEFDENLDTDGYLRKYRMSGQLGNGETFSYEARVDVEYRDGFPEQWLQFIRGYERIESHSLLSGQMEFEEETYTGRGLFEWKTSIFNPLVPDE